jgi:hypothetical protein
VAEVFEPVFAAIQRKNPLIVGRCQTALLGSGERVIGVGHGHVWYRIKATEQLRY